MIFFNYSNKSFVLFGEGTIKHKNDLKKLGGRWNNHLKGYPDKGWVFPKSMETDIKHKFKNASYNYYRQEYGIGLETSVYCGGTSPHSYWMSRQGILTALRACGYKQIDIIEDADSPNGPYLLLTAMK